MKRKGIWLTQAKGQTATGITMGLFRAKILPQLVSRPVPGKKKLEYFVTEDLLTEVYKKSHKDELIELDDENESDDIVNDILGDTTGINSVVQMDPENADLNEARRQEIIMRTKYLSQKIEKKKLELFEEWSERFFFIFSKNFAKFKNSLIELHLEENKLKTLNENLNFALENMETSLSEILNEYMNDDENENEKNV